jgi:hypothetical protein
MIENNLQILKSTSKKRVVCDTNIWYDLADTKDLQAIKNEYNFVATNSSLKELSNSEKLRISYNDFCKVRRACHTILKYADEIIFESPFLYLKNLLLPDRKASGNKELLKGIEDIAHCDFDESDFVKLIKDSIFNDDLAFKSDTLQNHVERLETTINLTRGIIHSNKETKYEAKQLLKRTDFKEDIEESMKRTIIQEIKNNSTFLDIDNFITENFWKHIEFYLKSRNQYHNNLNSVKTMKVEKNDAADMLNLIYVNDCYYWTEDTRWKNIFREAKMEKYLFPPFA